MHHNTRKCTKVRTVSIAKYYKFGDLLGAVIAEKLYPPECVKEIAEHSRRILDVISVETVKPNLTFISLTKSTTRTEDPGLFIPPCA